MYSKACTDRSVQVTNKADSQEQKPYFTLKRKAATFKAKHEETASALF